MPNAVVAQELMPWEFDSAALYYGGSDGRVKDFSINVLGKKEVREESYLNIKFAYDTSTGDLEKREAGRIEAKFSRYLKGNIVDRLNSAQGEPVAVDDETARLLDYELVAGRGRCRRPAESA